MPAHKKPSPRTERVSAKVSNALKESLLLNAQTLEVPLSSYIASALAHYQQHTAKEKSNGNRFRTAQ